LAGKWHDSCSASRDAHDSVSGWRRGSNGGIFVRCAETVGLVRRIEAIFARVSRHHLISTDPACSMHFSLLFSFLTRLAHHAERRHSWEEWTYPKGHWLLSPADPIPGFESPRGISTSAILGSDIGLEPTEALLSGSDPCSLADNAMLVDHGITTAVLGLSARLWWSGLGIFFSCHHERIQLPY
jgi:hypothetical protein